MAAGAATLAIAAAAGGAMTASNHHPAARATLPAASVTAAPHGSDALALQGVTPQFQAGHATPAPAQPPTKASAPPEQVAWRFAQAFVGYEVGRSSKKTGAAFAQTATKPLAKALAEDPPRLPSNRKVPQARVLNVVLGAAGKEQVTGERLARPAACCQRSPPHPDQDRRRVAGRTGPRLMGRVRRVIAATVVGAAIAAPVAAAQTTTTETEPTTTTDPPEPPVQSIPPATALPPTRPAPKPKGKPQHKAPQKPSKNGGTQPKGGENEKGAAKVGGTAPPPPAPLVPTACGPVGVPAFLGPIYQAAAQAYDLGPPGPSILAAINEIESGFGQNLGALVGGGGGLDAVHAVDLGDLRRRRRRRRRQGPQQPRRRDLRRRPLPARRRHARPTPTARSSPTTTPTGTSPRCWPTPPASTASATARSAASR